MQPERPDGSSGFIWLLERKSGCTVKRSMEFEAEVSRHPGVSLTAVSR
jgi:hypothetical protein